MKSLITKIRTYWQLIKSLQTGLLLLTGIAGYLSFHPENGGAASPWLTLLNLSGSLFLAISGSTVLNMWYDRDIDALMERTCNRPLSCGRMKPGEALILGLLLSALGVGWALFMDVGYGLVVAAGLFFDVVVYTVWLKRRTCWSIVWGGLAGGMPVLAGRVLAAGQVDGIGILLSAAVLFWIPTHILTFSIRHQDDYLAAGVPTFPSTYGTQATLKIIALSSILASLAMSGAIVWIGLTAGLVRVILVLSAGLLFLAVTSMLRPSNQLNFGLFEIRLALHDERDVDGSAGWFVSGAAAGWSANPPPSNGCCSCAAALLAGYQVAVGIEGLGRFEITCYTIGFGVILVASLLLMIMGFEILGTPAVVVLSTLIP